MVISLTKVGKIRVSAAYFVQKNVKQNWGEKIAFVSEKW